MFYVLDPALLRLTIFFQPKLINRLKEIAVSEFVSADIRTLATKPLLLFRIFDLRHNHLEACSEIVFFYDFPHEKCINVQNEILVDGLRLLRTGLLNNIFTFFETISAIFVLKGLHVFDPKSRAVIAIFETSLYQIFVSFLFSG